MTTLDDHNFLVRSPFCTFLDSMERYLSIESNHMLRMAFDSHIISEKLIIALSALITRKKKPGNLGCHSLVSEPRFINT